MVAAETTLRCDLPQVVMLFAGQGTQKVGMASELATQQVFSAAMLFRILFSLKIQFKN